jgi:hypothetical protein
MISKMRKFSLPVTITPTGTDPTGIFWNTDTFYYSNDASKSFYISFPKSPVSIHEIKIKTINDVYPNDFSISVSYDNETWKTIIKNATLCDASTETTKHTKSTACLDQLIRKFEAERIDGFFSHLKFEMFSNTYKEGADFINLISIRGFEINGKFLTEHKECTSGSKCHNPLIWSLFLICG